MRPLSRHTLWPLLLTLFAVACADALVDLDYHGEPLFHLEGKVEQLESPGFTGTWGAPGAQSWDAEEEEALAQGQLQLAVFWSPDTKDAKATGTVAAVEQQAVTTAAFPARYQLTLYRPPPANLLHQDPDGQGRYAIGLVIIYVDMDRNGVWNPEIDRLVGGASGRAIAYAPTGADSVHFGHLEPGYHRLRQVTGKSECTADGRRRMKLDADPDLDLQMAAWFSPTVLVDLDCDGHAYEWKKACPSRKTVEYACKKYGDKVWPCKGCDD